MALTLLELVSRAGPQGEDGDASNVDAESAWSTRLKPSVAQTSDFVFRKGEKKTIKGVEVDYLEDLIVRKDEGWEVNRPNALEENLVEELKAKLENPGTFLTSDFMAMVKPALERVTKEAGMVFENRRRNEKAIENGAVDGNNNPSDHSRAQQVSEYYFFKLLREGGPLVSRKLLASIINCALGFQFWSTLEVLTESGLVTSVSHPDLIQKLVSHRKADLLCLTFHYVLDLTPSDILTALKFLLDDKSNASLRAFEAVRQEWRKVASTAIDVAVRRKAAILEREKAIEREFTEKQRAARELALEKDPFAILPDEESVVFRVPLHERERRRRDEMTASQRQAVVRAVAVDGFQGYETCLHALVASGQDEAVLAAIIVELDAPQAVQLLQYLRKWLDRYTNRLSKMPSPKCKADYPKFNVPSSHQVIQWVNFVLDGQYTKCVLSSEFLPELKAIQQLVESVVAIGRKVAPMLGVIEHLQDKHPLPAPRQDSASHSDYTIEYLDIS